MNSANPDLSKPTCRVCLQNGNSKQMSSIFDLDPELDDVFIYEKIEQCANIEVLRDGNLPTSICEKCKGRLKVSYKFRMTCRNSDEILSKLATETISTKCEKSLEQNPLSINEKTSPSKNDLRSKRKIRVEKASSPSIDIIKDEIIPPDSPSNFEEPIDDNFEEYVSNIMSFEMNRNDDENGAYSDENAKVTIENIDLDSKEKKEMPLRNKRSRDRKSSKDVKGKKSPRGRPKKLKTCKNENGDDIMENEEKPEKEKKEKRPHICEICGNKFPHRYTLKNHIKRHFNEKSFNCEICGYSCHSNMELVRHLRTHTGAKPFKCHYCPRAFGDNSTLIKHERVHRNERPFKCNICGSSFSYPAVLKRHKLVHTGEKPYKCEICGKCFNDRYHLQSHLKTIQHKNDPRVEMLLQNITENNL